MPAARAAIEALGRAGIAGEKIFLHGSAAREAAEEPGATTPDAVAMRAFRSAAIMGALWGGIAGIAFGLPAGIIATAYLDRDSLATVVGGAFLGGTFMSAVGALISIMRLPADTETWELAMHEDSVGLAIVGVHSEDESEIEKARVTLDGQGPIEVRQVSGTIVRSPTPRAGATLPTIHLET